MRRDHEARRAYLLRIAERIEEMPDGETTGLAREHLLPLVADGPDPARRVFGREERKHLARAFVRAGRAAAGDQVGDFPLAARLLEYALLIYGLERDDRILLGRALARVARPPETELARTIYRELRSESFHNPAIVPDVARLGRLGLL